MTHLKKGQILTVPYRNQASMRVIVIDPDGQGEGRPTLGMGFGMTAENLGLPKSTLSEWTTEVELEGVRQTGANTLETIANSASDSVRQAGANTPTRLLTAPSGNVYPVYALLDETGNTQMVIEGCDWVDLACDVSDKPGRVKKTTIAKLNSFVRWVAKKGFYATVYAQILGSYTASDDNRLNGQIELLEEEKKQLIEEVKQLKEENYELQCENALLDHKANQGEYFKDEALNLRHWHKANSWNGME